MMCKRVTHFAGRAVYKFAPIVTFKEFDEIRPRPQHYTIVATSGGYDPIHPGHISCIIESKKLGSILVVIVNGDSFLKAKKGKAFMPLETRCKIVAGIKEVDYVIPFEIENDQTVIKALEQLKPHVFTKGGDRIDEKTIPEWDTCKKWGIKIKTGVGDPKMWSSSDFLKDWGEWYLDNKCPNCKHNRHKNDVCLESVQCVGCTPGSLDVCACQSDR